MYYLSKFNVKRTTRKPISLSKLPRVYNKMGGGDGDGGGGGGDDGVQKKTLIGSRPITEFTLMKQRGIHTRL